MYILNFRFEWDEAKDASNATKHGVGFREAATLFTDPEALDGADLAHSGGEWRSLRIGRTHSGRILVVAYTVRRRNTGAEAIRIISARPANRRERAAYATKP